MRIENTRWAHRQGHAELLALLDGHECSIPAEQKPTLAELGILFVVAVNPQDVFADQLSLVHVPAAEGRTEHDLESCVQDSELFRLWREMMLAIERDPATFLEQAEDLDEEGS